VRCILLAMAALLLLMPATGPADAGKAAAPSLAAAQNGPTDLSAAKTKKPAKKSAKKPAKKPAEKVQYLRAAVN
jgi:hypothetical protein